VSTLLLVRHAAHYWLGRGIPGRLPGVALNEQGRSQVQELAQRLAGTRIDVIYSSPQQRARETVAPLSEQRRVAVETAEEFDEIDFGQWTGRTFAQLEAEDAQAWQHWIHRRGTAQPTGGEAFAQVAQRAMRGLERLRDLHPKQNVLVVSHGDVIKAAIACCLGLSLDNLERFDIAPASMTVLVAAGDHWQVKVLNQALTGPLPPA
jgi:broad specificity phosphatase PhoE